MLIGDRKTNTTPRLISKPRKEAIIYDLENLMTNNIHVHKIKVKTLVSRMPL